MEGLENLPEVRIESDGEYTSVQVNGKEVPGVIGFTVTQSGRGICELQLTICTSHLSMDKAMLVYLPEPWRNEIYQYEHEIDEVPRLLPGVSISSQRMEKARRAYAEEKAKIEDYLLRHRIRRKIFSEQSDRIQESEREDIHLDTRK